MTPEPSSTHPLHLRRSGGPLTSHLAAEHVVGSGLNRSQKAEVLAALERFPGSTAAELAAAMGTTRHIVGRRLPELADDGLVRRCPARRCQRTGRQATTWRAGRELTRREDVDTGTADERGRPPTSQELICARDLLRRAVAAYSGEVGEDEADAVRVLGNWFRDLLGEE